MSEILKIHNFPCVIGMQPSPFGLKLETWLRMAQIPYDVSWSFTKLGPKGKVPFVTLDGEEMGDSELVIQELASRFDRDLDQHLSMQERARGLMIRRLLEEELYFIIVYSRWEDPEVWPAFSKRVFSGVPFVIRNLIKSKGGKSVRNTIKAQGISRHSADEIYAKAVRDLECLAVTLGSKTYIHGEVPTLTDASLYGHLANIYYQPDEGQLQRDFTRFENLVSYTKRLKAEYFPESALGGGEEVGYRPQAMREISRLKTA
jgi:glutathione S-transferase